MRLLWEYTSTDWTVHDSAENGQCMLQFSILVKMLHNIFEHNNGYVILSGVLLHAFLQLFCMTH